MNYTTVQIIILINNSLNINKKREITSEIRNFIEEISKKIEIKYKNFKKLAYKINNYETAYFAAMRIQIKKIGVNKKIRQIEEKLNTYEEIIEFKIIEKNKI